jgi:hypothetical protein
MSEDPKDENLNEIEQEIEVVTENDDKIEAKSDSFDELSPEDGIKQLKERLEAEKRARENAERMAYEARVQVQQAQRSVQDTDLNLIVSAIETTRRNSEILKSAYAEAMTIGDHRKAADIQEAISLNSNKLYTLENGKSSLEAKLKQPVEPIKPPVSDPVEMIASQLTPRSAAWIRAHPDLVSNEKAYQRMIGAHNLAVGDGYVPDTDAYFEALENTLGVKNQQKPAEVVQEQATSTAAAPVQKRQSAPISAPSSRVASTSSGKPNTVRLNRDQQEMATIMGMTAEEYAQNLSSLRREGKIN